MSVMRCNECNTMIDTDVEEYDFENYLCLECHNLYLNRMHYCEGDRCDDQT